MSDRTYEIRITGLLPTLELLEGLGDVDMAEHEFRTVLSGHFADQAALYAFIHRLRSYGLEVVEVRRVAGTTAQAGGEPAPATGDEGSSGP